MNSQKAVTGFLILVLLGIAVLFGLHACADRSVDLTSSGTVRITDDRVGTGHPAEIGKEIQVRYRGYLPDGSTLMDVWTNSKTHTFRLGDGTVIPGFVDGLKGMREGGRRTIVVPPQGHYGRRGFAGVVPPNSPIRFEVELIAVRQ